MDWQQVKNFPKYNPFTFQLARNCRYLSRTEVFKSTKITVKRIAGIEAGEFLPTEGDFILLMAMYKFPEKFFQEWHETRLDISGPLAKNIPIDYYQYKIFREINPTPFTVYKKLEPEPIKPQAKILQL